MQHLALVVRRDGTVPFDKQEDGSEHPHKALFLADLKARGHDLLHAGDCDHHHGHACTCDPKIVDWDASKGLNNPSA